MNYNIDLPEELKVLSMPSFKVKDKALIIINKPYWWDLVVPVTFIVAFFVMILNGKVSFKDPGYGDYLILLFFLMFFILIQYFSLNKVLIDFEKKLISIKNYNPLVNLWRKLFQMPFAINFNEVDKIFTDRNWFNGQIIRFYVILETDTPYKFRIAIFSKQQESIVFAEYIKNRIRRIKDAQHK